MFAAFKKLDMSNTIKSNTCYFTESNAPDTCYATRSNAPDTCCLTQSNAPDTCYSTESNTLDTCYPTQSNAPDTCYPTQSNAIDTCYPTQSNTPDTCCLTQSNAPDTCYSTESNTLDTCYPTKSNALDMRYLRRNAKTVAVRAIKAGNQSLLEKLLKTGLVDPSSPISITPESQSSTSRLVCSTISPLGLESESCRCGLDVAVCRGSLQRATLLELAASCGQVRNQPSSISRSFPAPRISLIQIQWGIRKLFLQGLEWGGTLRSPTSYRKCPTP